MSLRAAHFLFVGIFTGVGACSGAPQDTSPADHITVFENQGRPMTVPFHCTEDDIAWAGLSCTDQDPCPAYFELAAAEPLGNKLFVAGNIHSEAVTLYSVLFASDDGGKLWHEAHERIRGAGLDHIQFLDLANGWASGEALSPLPQDPFFLITADGGANWKVQPVLEEGEPGSIQQFYFTSKDTGTVIIDRGEGSEQERYVLYESPNGGRTWNVKQLSRKPLSLNRPEERDKDWRVRAERGTQSFRIERRQGDRWNEVASFAVSAGACKPGPPEASPAAPGNPQH
ncbi:MAG: hypothetical protein JO099_23495 [Acidobacteriia bacterium]|nr:hypothetical protein [Terriglobia bacterium]